MSWVDQGTIEWPPKSGNQASRMLIHKEHKTKVLVSKSRMTDGSEWIHVSVSKKMGKPTWTEMQGIKNQFIGQSKEAIQVFPKTQDLVDIHDVYHLWHHLSGPLSIPNLQCIEWEIA